MTYLRFTTIGTSLWGVQRGTTKIGEVALDTKDKVVRFIPVAPFAYTAEEIDNVAGFMASVTGREDNSERARR